MLINEIIAASFEIQKKRINTLFGQNAEQMMKQMEYIPKD
jgi:hypothetical protein